MERNEVNELIKTIEIHRPYFKSKLGKDTLQDLLKEWTNILAPYDYEDVKQNLYNFLNNESNYGKDPDVFILKKGLFTLDQKKDNAKGKIACQFCGRYLPILEMDKHESRCRSIKYLQRLYRTYFNRELEVKDLYNLNDKTFDESYIKVLEKVLPKVESDLERRGITNVIETYYGREPIYSYREL